jgi:gliding motility-associated-like protein
LLIEKSVICSFSKSFIIFVQLYRNLRMKYFFFTIILSLSILGIAQPTASFAISDNVICEGDCIDIENNSSNDVVSSSWSFPSGTPSFYSGMNPGQVCFTTAGTYTLLLTVTDANGATSSASQQITVGSVPTISIGLLDTIGGVPIDDTLISMYGGMWPTGQPTSGAVIVAYGYAAGDSLVWETPNGGNDVWCFGDVAGICDTVIVTPFFDSYYILNNISPEGCIASDTVFINVRFQDSVKISVPDAFSPNGDGTNDMLRVVTNVDKDSDYSDGFDGDGGAIVSMNFQIFNRYGQLVFRTTDPNEGWDGTFKGKALNVGNFAYKLEYRLINGLTGSIDGNVMLYK